MNVESQEVFVSAESAKTGVSRTLPISKSVAMSIARLIALNKKVWNMEYVFCTCEGNKMTMNAWKKRMIHYSRKLNTSISSYDLRHAFAMLYLKNGGDAFTLQRLMGHTDMEMTKQYLKFSQADLENAHKNASPLSNLTKKQRIRNLK